MRIVNLTLRWIILVTSLFCLLVIVIPLSASHWDVNSIIRVGTRYSKGDVHGSEGYDGQFNLFIAQDPRPEGLKSKLDMPAYRYQRILLPLLARGLALGNYLIIPWMLIVLPLLGQLLGTFFVYRVLELFQVPPFYSLIYGLGAGYLLSIRLALAEPIAFAFVAGAIYFFELKKYPISYLLFALAFFTKEVTILFGASFLLYLMVEKKYKESITFFCLAFLPFIIFQFWLFNEFGKFGIGSGGAMATRFEVIPFMGLIRIARYSLIYFLAMAITFLPLVIVPSLWGVIISLRSIAKRDWNPIGFSLLLNSLIMFFLPFSTYRETGGILRFSCGLTLAVLLFAAKYHNTKVLNYSLFWLVYNLFLLKGITG